MNLIKDDQKRTAGITIFFFHKRGISENLSLVRKSIPVEIQTLSKLTLIVLGQRCFPHLTWATDKGHFVEFGNNRINQTDSGTLNHSPILDQTRKKS